MRERFWRLFHDWLAKDRAFFDWLLQHVEDPPRADPSDAADEVPPDG